MVPVLNVMTLLLLVVPLVPVEAVVEPADCVPAQLASDARIDCLAYEPPESSVGKVVPPSVAIVAASTAVVCSVHVTVPSTTVPPVVDGAVGALAPVVPAVVHLSNRRTLLASGRTVKTFSATA